MAEHRVSDETLREWAAVERAPAWEVSVAARELLALRAAERRLSVIEYDPELGCVDCPYDYRLPGSTAGETLHFCAAEHRLRRDEAHRRGHACGPPRRVSRHPAPDWCPLRGADVMVRGRRG